MIMTLSRQHEYIQIYLGYKYKFLSSRGTSSTVQHQKFMMNLITFFPDIPLRHPRIEGWRDLRLRGSNSRTTIMIQMV